MSWSELATPTGGYATNVVCDPPPVSGADGYEAGGANGEINEADDTDFNGVWGWVDSGTQAYQRKVKTVMKLRTGGRPGSTRQNLFCLHAAAEQRRLLTQAEMAADADLGDDYDLGAFTDVGPVDPAQITVNGQALGSDGNRWTTLPDNASPDMDVTPQAKGADNYMFAEPTPTKYHCYFTAYAEEPNPGGGSWSLYHSGGFGHSWWVLSSDAPSEGLQKIGVPYLHYLSGAAGFFPEDWTRLLIFGPFDTSSPGILKYPDGSGSGSEAVHRRREIGIKGLIGCLNFTQNLGAYPPTYDLYYDNCTTETVKAGAAAGVILPSDKNPQDFGLDLNTLPPDE